MVKDFASLIGSWPRKPKRTAIGSFAEDIGIEYQHAATMKQRNSIAPEFWPKVLKAAKAAGKALTHEQLLRMREAKRKNGARPRPRANARSEAEAA